MFMFLFRFLKLITKTIYNFLIDFISNFNLLSIENICFLLWSTTYC